MMRRFQAFPLCLLFAAAPASAAEDVVARVEIRENRLLSQETLLYYVSTKPGHRYDPIRLREDFRRLWATGFLDDLTLGVSEGPGDKVVTFVVQERPRVRIVDYRGSKAFTTTKISEQLKEDAFRLDGFYDRAQARRIEGKLQQMLGAAGFPFAQVRHEAKPLGNAGVQVSFVIEDGNKALVKSITFRGNQAFSDGTLRRRMRKLKERGFWNLSWLTGKSVFAREKWDEDRRQLENFFLDRGRVASTVGEPILNWENGRAGLFRRRPVKWLRLEVPVSEGGAYRVGEVRFEGLTVFKEEDVRPLFGLETGALYRDSRVRKGFEKLRDAYGNQGYIQFTGLALRTPDPERSIVDVTLKVDEDQRYAVGRITLTGNDTTKDKVIRREIFLNEGDVLSTEALKQTIRRLNQLGYFKPVEPPSFEKTAGRDDAFDLTFRLQEQNRNRFTLSAGVGAVQGATYTASFASSNFLGGGQTVQLDAERGSIYHRYQLGLVQPYLFDRPFSAGFDVWKERLAVSASAADGRPGYVSDRVGTRLSAGLFAGRFTRLLTDYSYTIIDIAPTSSGEASLVDAGRWRESRLGPSLVYDTVDSPFTPRRGVRLAGTLALSGGPLGGTVSLFEPSARAVGYVPLTRRTALGFRAETAWLLPFGATAVIDPVNGRNGVPFDKRFRLGGETQLRGFDQLSVGPRDAAGTLVGGNKFVLGSAEAYYDFGAGVRGVLFLDAGQAYREGDRIDLRRLRTSTGVELRFLLPVLNVPIRLIQYWNLAQEPGSKPRGFRFSFGASF